MHPQNVLYPNSMSKILLNIVLALKVCCNIVNKHLFIVGLKSGVTLADPESVKKYL